VQVSEGIGPSVTQCRRGKLSVSPKAAGFHYGYESAKRSLTWRKPLLSLKA
jgi:hypothetical protein